jgi:hypothetical protein
MGYQRQVMDHRVAKRREYVHGDAYWMREDRRNRADRSLRTRLDKREQRRNDSRSVHNYLYER